MGKSMGGIILCQFISISYILGCYIFFRGYFPVPKLVSDPNSFSHYRIDPGHEGPTPRIVWMVIDALRADLVANGSVPFLSRMDELGHLRSYVALAEPPTVTLPRVKALTTGTVPEFLDVLHNYEGQQLAQDSLLRQLRQAGRRAVFYGDDTWPKLFPDSFVRSEGVHSFFVNDYTEVDDNVTRHLADELARDDWDMLVMHYVGLDHIGHLAGPTSALVPVKLAEMSRIMEKVYTALNRRPDGAAPVLVVCGDHGMSDAGSHGGASAGELRTALHFVSADFAQQLEAAGSGEVRQVDIAPTLAALAGVPPPADSVGALIRDVVRPLGGRRLAHALLQNGRQLLLLYRGRADLREQDDYDAALSRAEALLDAGRVSDAADAAGGAVQRLQAELLPGSSGHDWATMLLGLAIIALTLAGSLLSVGAGSSLLVPVRGAGLALCCVVVALLLLCLLPGDGRLSWLESTVAASAAAYWLRVVAEAAFALAAAARRRWRGLQDSGKRVVYSDVTFLAGLNMAPTHKQAMLERRSACYSKGVQAGLLKALLPRSLYKLVARMYPTKGKSRDNGKCNFQNDDLEAIIQTQVFSEGKAAGSEEADALLKLIRPTPLDAALLLGSLLHLVSFAATSFIEEEHQTWYFLSTSLWLALLVLEYRHGRRAGGAVAVCLGVAVLGGVLRRWNQTGDRWLHLSDIGDWLSSEAGAGCRRVGWLAGLLAVVLLSPARRHVPLQLAAGCVLVLVHGLSDARLWPAPPVSPVLGRWAARGLYASLLWWTVLGRHRRPLARLLVGWRLLCALLARPHNLPAWALCCGLVHLVSLWLTARPRSPLRIALLLHWTGMAGFFYMGNSNSLASVDVSAGYVGVAHHNSWVAVLLTACHTYAAPVLAALTALQTAEHTRCVGEVLVWLTAARGAALLASCCAASVFVHHLFVWSVFAPKLLYEAAASAVMLAVSLLALLR